MSLRFHTTPASLISFIFTALVILTRINNALSAGGQCPQVINDEIQLCVQPVAEYAKVLNQQQDTSSAKPAASSGLGQAIQIGLPKIGGQVFRELCRLIREFETCVEGFREKCRKHITINLISSSYGFLCNEGYDTFMKSADCLMDLDQKPSVKKCHNDTLRKIEMANNEATISMPMKLERMCDALNSFSGCVMTPIATNCGVEAWKVIFRVLKDTTKTLMPACQFPERALPKNIPILSEDGNMDKNSPAVLNRPKENEISDQWLFPKTDRPENHRQRLNSSSKAIGRSPNEKSRIRPKILTTTLSYNKSGERRKFAQVSEGSPNNGNRRNALTKTSLFIAVFNANVIVIAFFIFS